MNLDAVIPAKAGIHLRVPRNPETRCLRSLDPGLRRDDS
jgi:hypothetical protein